MGWVRLAAGQHPWGTCTSTHRLMQLYLVVVTTLVPREKCDSIEACPRAPNTRCTTIALIPRCTVFKHIRMQLGCQ